MAESINSILKINVITLPKGNKNNVNNVRAIANKLVEKLNDAGSYKFFCKIAWKLPEAIIWSNLEQALQGKNPRAYFTFLCKLSLEG